MASIVHTIVQIPKEWREQLRTRGVRSGRSIEHSRMASPDGTVKFLLQARMPVSGVDEQNGPARIYGPLCIIAPGCV